jgi:hypothetical protein
VCKTSAAANAGAAADSIIIWSDKLKIKNGAKIFVDMKAKRRFWQGFGVDDISAENSEGGLTPFSSCKGGVV